MKEVTIRQLQAYLKEHYKDSRTEEGLFIKLVEEVGEVAEVLNGRSGRKEGKAGQGLAFFARRRNERFNS